MTFLNIFLNLKLKHSIKGEIAQIEKKQSKLTYKLNYSENSNMKKQKLNQSKITKCVFATTSNLKFVQKQYRNHL